ncbi:MAG: aldo/keto reductase [Spirochaetales bacterium]|nr:MAG: aldo/keto reductase [Spirochaetales bacterium]
MEYRRLGKSGLKVSALSYGSWVTFSNQLQTGSALECMNYAYDQGVNFFDNAEAYADGKSEIIMGEALKKAGWPRDSFIVSSKVFFGSNPDRKPNQTGLSRKHVVEACHQALKRLQVDYLDLYFCHRPDPDTPIEETVFTMDSLIRQGKVLYWGTSEWSAQEIMEAYSTARQYGLIPPTMEQPQYNMLERERFEKEYARLYEGIGLGTTIWSPLASGFLTGKYLDGVPEGSRLSLKGYEWLKERHLHEKNRANGERVRRLIPIAEESGLSMAQLAIAWTLKNPNVSTVILGASRLTQLKENMKALEVSAMLTAEVMEKIEGALANKPE